MRSAKRSAWTTSCCRCRISRSRPVFYRKFFGKETSRERTPERIWFTAARTRLGLEKMAEGQMPHIDRFGIRVAAFDRQAVTRKLGAIGVTVLPSTGGNVCVSATPTGSR